MRAVRAPGEAGELTGEPMDAKKVQTHAAELRDLISLGPGHNPEVLRKALGIVRAMRAAAMRDYRRQILDDLKERLKVWFSDRRWRGDQAELRRGIIQDLAELGAAWEALEGIV